MPKQSKETIVVFKDQVSYGGSYELNILMEWRPLLSKPHGGDWGPLSEEGYKHFKGQLDRLRRLQRGLENSLTPANISPSASRQGGPYDLEDPRACRVSYAPLGTGSEDSSISDGEVDGGPRQPFDPGDDIRLLQNGIDIRYLPFADQFFNHSVYAHHGLSVQYTFLNGFALALLTSVAAGGGAAVAVALEFNAWQAVLVTTAFAIVMAALCLCITHALQTRAAIKKSSGVDFLCMGVDKLEELITNKTNRIGSRVDVDSEEDEVEVEPQPQPQPLDLIAGSVISCLKDLREIREQVIVEGQDSINHKKMVKTLLHVQTGPGHEAPAAGVLIEKMNERKAHNQAPVVTCFVNDDQAKNLYEFSQALDALETAVRIGRVSNNDPVVTRVDQAIRAVEGVGAWFSFSRKTERLPEPYHTFFRALKHEVEQWKQANAKGKINLTCCSARLIGVPIMSEVERANQLVSQPRERLQTLYDALKYVWSVSCVAVTELRSEGRQASMLGDAKMENDVGVDVPGEGDWGKMLRSIFKAIFGFYTGTPEEPDAIQTTDQDFKKFLSRVVRDAPLIQEVIAAHSPSPVPQRYYNQYSIGTPSAPPLPGEGGQKLTAGLNHRSNLGKMLAATLEGRKGNPNVGSHTCFVSVTSRVRVEGGTGGDAPGATVPGHCSAGQP